MPPGDHAASLGNLFGCAAQDLADDVRRQLGRKGGNAQCQDHLPAHGINVTHGICRSYRAIGIGIVNHGREKIDGKDEGLLVADPVDGGIVRRRESHQEVGKPRFVKGLAQGAQNLRQVVRRPFRRSAGSRGQSSEPHIVPVNLAHGFLLASLLAGCTRSRGCHW